MMLQAAVPLTTGRLTQQIELLLAQRADQWGVRPSDIRVLSLHRSHRRVSTLIQFQARIGEQQCQMLAKQYRPWRPPTEWPETSQDPMFPRLFAPPAIDDKAPQEHAALVAMHEHFGNVDDRRFAAVQPLAVFPEQRTVVMVHSPDPSLATLLGGSFIGGSKGRLEAAFRSAGAWLGEFHRLPLLPHTRTRQASRHAFVETISRAAEFVAEALDDPNVDSAAGKLVAAAEELPESLPLGLSHSDFAPRNVLVSADGRVSVIDTLGRWKAPIYEDIGHFLAAIETTEWQMLSQGWLWSPRTIGKLKAAFVAGYFADSAPPWRSMKLFEAQAALFKWASSISGLRQTAGFRRWTKHWRLMARSHFLGRYLARIVGEIAA
jgi:hypothetical protein